ncbi:hypothetical protein BBOV_III001915 [Babesia bovis T2Bo]|uniref:hypothetical protein n=1 Tax=Babesia bovis T2Bo TaxID=484906 RepID=UPI001C3483CA|nr:hypothetical protein BBOV_III001915 [Babesia bovis T2Bo]KAG6440029.1 hypothetical protein BBOV_III001915 [Babesia bovis T2Bo]
MLEVYAMGASGSTPFENKKRELIKYINLAICRVDLLSNRLSNDLNATIHDIIQQRRDVYMCSEQTIYIENTLVVYQQLSKDLSTLKIRKHLISSKLDKQLEPCVANIIHCADKLDVPELGRISTLLRKIYGNELELKPTQELLDKLNRPVPSRAEMSQQIERYKKLEQSRSNIRVVNEPTPSISTKRAEIDDLLERIQRLRS